MEAEATAELFRRGVAPTDDSHKYLWNQVGKFSYYRNLEMLVPPIFYKYYLSSVRVVSFIVKVKGNAC